MFGHQAPPLKTNKQKTVDGEIRSQIKELLMEFNSYSKQELTYALELCEYNLKLTQAYLRVTSKSKVKATINDFLTGKIEPGVEALGFKPDKKLLKEDTTEKEETKEEDKVEEFIPTGPNFFETKVTNEVIHYILDFLDPASPTQAGFTYKTFYKVSKHPHIYKKFCRKLYLQYPSLPKDSPFSSLVNRINTAPLGEFEPRFIASANQNIQAIVWQPSIKSFYTPTNYFKQFKNYREVFMNAGRVRFGRVYMMKEKYVGAGSKDLTGFYDPCHVVEFFRYFQVLP